MLARGSGVLTRDEAEAFGRKAAADPANTPETPELVDLAEVETTELIGRDMRYLAALATQLLDPPKPVRCAFVVKSDLLYGLARQYLAGRAEAAREMKIFRDRSEALRWLEGEG